STERHPVIVATGPLTSDALSAGIATLVGADHLYFYDAISPIVLAETIDRSKVFRASRWDRSLRPSRGADGVRPPGPGEGANLEQAEFVRFGMVHRNTYVNGPTVLAETWQVRRRPSLFFAGQMSGVEGYVESAASGLVTGLNAAALARGEPTAAPPRTTAIGALSYYVARPDRRGEGVVEDGPSARVATPKRDVRMPAHLSENEMEALVAAPAADTPLTRRDRAILELFYASGLRLSELVGLDVDDVNLSVK